MAAAVDFDYVSRVRYRSFRELDLRNRRSYIFVLPIAAILVAIVMRPKIVLPVLCSVYLVSGPVLYLRDRRTLRSGSRVTSEGRSTRDTEVADEPALR